MPGSTVNSPLHGIFLNRTSSITRITVRQWNTVDNSLSLLVTTFLLYKINCFFFLRTQPKDILIQINDRKISSFKNNGDIVNFLRRIEEKRVKIRVVKIKLLHTEMVSF